MTWSHRDRKKNFPELCVIGTHFQKHVTGKLSKGWVSFLFSGEFVSRFHYIYLMIFYHDDLHSVRWTGTACPFPAAVYRAAALEFLE